jgi:hypothetical protein
MAEIIAFERRQTPPSSALPAVCDAEWAADIAAVDFEPIAEFVNFPNIGERAEAHEAELRTFGIATRWSIAILGQSKTKLVEIVREIDADNPKIADDLLRDLMAARDFLRGINGMLETAANRLGVAIAVNSTTS